MYTSCTAHQYTQKKGTVRQPRILRPKRRAPPAQKTAHRPDDLHGRPRLRLRVSLSVCLPGPLAAGCGRSGAQRLSRLALRFHRACHLPLRMMQSTPLASLHWARPDAPHLDGGMLPGCSQDARGRGSSARCPPARGPFRLCRSPPSTASRAPPSTSSRRLPAARSPRRRAHRHHRAAAAAG